jgi:GntR family transcriptional regulator, rspAB operon transcriptional repressor
MYYISNRPPLPESSKIVRGKNLVQQVYQLLYVAIISLWLKPGQPLREKEICEQLQISRTPVREALLRLANERLIVILDRSGTYVSRISIEDVRESQLIRESLENATVRDAARNWNTDLSEKLSLLLEQQKLCIKDNNRLRLYELDEMFHRTIVEFRFSSRLWKIINNAKAQMDRVRILALPLPRRAAEIVEEHSRIYEALCSGNEKQAVEAMTFHLNTVFTSLEQLLEKHHEYFEE